MEFSSCGKYFVTFVDSTFVVYDSKTLKFKYEFEKNSYDNDYSSNSGYLSSDAKFLVSKDYSGNIFVYSGVTGNQVRQYLNYSISFHGFMNSNHLIGVYNGDGESYICKLKIDSDRQHDKINTQYSDKEIFKSLYDVNFNQKGKCCAFNVNN